MDIGKKIRERHIELYPVKVPQEIAEPQREDEKVKPIKEKELEPA